MATDDDADDDDDGDDDGDHDDDDEDAHVDVDGDELATLCSLDPLSKRLLWAAATDGKPCSGATYQPCAAHAGQGIRCC